MPTSCSHCSPSLIRPLQCMFCTRLVGCHPEQMRLICNWLLCLSLPRSGLTLNILAPIHTCPAQALAAEIAAHEYDHVAYFNNKIALAGAVAPSKPQVLMLRVNNLLAQWARCKPAHATEAHYSPGLHLIALMVLAWSRGSSGRHGSISPMSMLCVAASHTVMRIIFSHGHQGRSLLLSP